MLLRPTLCSFALATIATLGLGGCSGSSGSTETTPPPAPTGKIDASYGAAGKATLGPTFGATVDSAGSVYAAGRSIVKLDPSGNVVAGYGETLQVFDESSPVLDAQGNLYTLSNGIVKRDANGQRVTAFGTGGLAVIPPLSPSTSGVFIGLLRDSTGNLYTAWLFADAQLPYSNARVILTKVNSSGFLDSGFGVSGQKDTGLDLVAPSPSLALALDRDGNVLVAGYLKSTLRLFVAKFDSHGNLVPDFGGGGIWQAPQDCGTQSPIAIAALPSGELVVGGSCSGSSAIYKLDAKGAPVNAFNGGVVHLPGAVGGFLAGANGVLYVGGGLGACGQGAVRKLGADGQLIDTFGNGGVVVPPDLQSLGLAVLGLDGSGRLYVGASVSGCPPVIGRPLAFAVYRMSG